METTSIYTNGTKLFTLENYGKAAGVCHANGITFHSTVNKLKAQAMHSKGQLSYVFGFGDSKHLAKEVRFKRNTTVGPFTIR